MQSPIEPLFNAIAASPYRVAPETSLELGSLIVEKSIRLEFCSDKQMRAELQLSRNIVCLGVPFLEVLWAAAYAYIVVYNECQLANKSGATFFSIADTPRTAAAYQLYRDLLQAHAAGSPIAWPLSARQPERYPQEGTDGYIANELFLVAVSWIIHHEIAHARLEHQAITVSSINEENDADRTATRSVCGTTEESQPLQKRAMGIVAALLLLIAYDLEVPRAQSSTHPPPFERLILNLDATNLGENEMVYGFAFKLVEIHLLQSRVPYEINRTGTFREMFVSACLALRKGATGG